MQNITLKAYAKVNLFLCVGELTPSGKHEVSTVLHRVEIYDTVSVCANEEGVIKLWCSDPELPVDENNIAYSAAKQYFEISKLSCGADISIEKNIPVKAGMGGGSSDAAAVLLALNKIHGALSFDQIVRIAAELGADVPFFLYERDAMLGTGAGDVLINCPAIESELYGVFVLAGEKQSTGKMYALLDKVKSDTKLKSADRILAALEEQDVLAILGAIENEFELVNEHFVGIRSELEAMGAKRVFLCGSGPTACAVFDDEAQAKRISKELRYTSFVAKLNTK